jgi:hypothetical protein
MQDLIDFMIFFTKRRVFGLLAISIFLCMQSTYSQSLKPSEKKEFKEREDSLVKMAYQIVFANEAEQRFRSDSLFIKNLVRALKLKNSFYYPFDSLINISRLYSPDSAFRIFTWQLKKDEYTYLQRGAIQMQTPDGSLKLIGLHDVSMFTEKPTDSIRTANNWIGAIYYRIILKTNNGKKIYTLLGFDDFTINSNKKWMEILTFNNSGEPVFGGPYISFREDSAKKNQKEFFRFNIQYKKEASTTFNYDPDMDMIVYDQLISESEEPGRKETYIPDGDFEGFKWKNGQWMHVGKVFDFKLKDGQFPQDEKILDEAGGANEQKLMEQSEKNRQKKGKQKPPRP